ncbi:MAG: chemotaxis protein histidine kinaselike protein, partial [Verrucomicrobiales bacterium]|nr:chemotaxis protein histidine kinaselike protein [Verrucomicrobiales bacterium]
RIAHAMEDDFVALQEGRIKLGAAAIDTLLRAVDFLGKLSQLEESELPSWAEQNRPAVDNLVADLQRILSGSVEEPVPSSASPKAPTIEAEAQDFSGVSMIELFQTEVGTQAALLNEGLLELENSPYPPELVPSLMRAAHSLKGAARIVGFDGLVHLAHEMESSFVKAQEGNFVFQPEQVDVLLSAVDFLTSMPRLSEAEFVSWLSARSSVLADLKARIGSFDFGAPSGKAESQSTEMAVAKVAAPVPVLAASENKAVSTAPKTSVSKPAGGAAGGADRAVRVGAQNLNRLMELAAESLVEARGIKPFGDSLLKLKTTHAANQTALWQLRELLQSENVASHLVQSVRDLEHRLEQMREGLNRRLEDFEGFLRRTTLLSDRLYHEVIASRMRPFGDGVSGFPRLVRDLARTLGKKVRFTLAGKGTEVDRDILEKLEAPLNHILRNGLDHGLELPAERVSKGKPEEGQLKLEARHAAGMLYITVTDDGRGIDRERLRKKIIQKGMVPAEAGARLNDAELLEFLFLPGFSTAEKVTEISGRGVGLDVVQTMVQEVGGTVRIISQPGTGTTFHLQLPITRSVIRALIVEISGEPYAFPLPRLDRVLKVGASELQTIEGRAFVHVDGKNVGIVPAFQVFELEPVSEVRDLLAILVISDRNHQYGLEVDRFLGERDLVVRPLDVRLGKVPDISATSVLEDGSPILIVDVDDLVRSIDSLLAGGRLAKSRHAIANAEEQSRKHILVIDDSITVRELERQLLESQGYEVDLAVDGMEGWNAVRLGQYDLVISDVDMPRMTGIELVKLIRNEQRFKAIPIIIVSYKDREEDRLRGLDAGANYYLTKSSFQDDTFLRAVHELIGKARQ